MKGIKTMKIKSIGKNQTILTIGNNEIFFSYETPVAGNIDGKFYQTNTKWSATTTRHINKYLDGTEAKLMDQGFFDNLISK